MTRKTAELRNPAPGRLELVGEVPHDRAVLGLRREGQQWIERCAVDGACEVELSGLTGHGSVPLSLMLSWLRHARSRGVRLSFTGMPQRMQSMAGLSGLGGLLGDTD